MILSHVNCFIHREVIEFQVLLDSLHPSSTRASWWSPLQFSIGEALRSSWHLFRMAFVQLVCSIILQATRHDMKYHILTFNDDCLCVILWSTALSRCIKWWWWWLWCCCRQSYDVEISVAVPGTTMKSCNVLDLKNPFFRYTGQQPQPPPGNNHTSPSETYWNQHDLTAGIGL